MWVPASETTEEQLDEKGLSYSKYRFTGEQLRDHGVPCDAEVVEGFLVEKTDSQESGDTLFRIAATALTLALDACGGLSGEQRFELVEKGPLALEDFASGLRESKPCRTVDFGECPSMAGTGRPFHRERVAHDRIGVAVALDGPGVDDLAAGLFDGLQGFETAGCGEAGFLVELPPGGFERVLVGELALRDGPRSLILPGPERPAWVDQEDFDSVKAPPVQQ